MIEFRVPLPPVSLRANSRAHWATKKRDADAYSETVLTVFNAKPSIRIDDCPHCHQPWEAAKVTYTWRYAGSQPDHSNLGGNTKYLQDILCMAPKNAKPGYQRWHLGIVEDDKGIEAEYRLEKVAHKAEEAVVVRIEKR